MLTMWTHERETLMIKMIEENPLLWDRQHPLYHKRDKREACLNQICEKLGPTFSGMAGTLTSFFCLSFFDVALMKSSVVWTGLFLTVYMVKKKWRIIRDQYFRLLKKSLQEEGALPKWSHFPKLNFLGDYFISNESKDSFFSSREVNILTILPSSQKPTPFLGKHLFFSLSDVVA